MIRNGQQEGDREVAAILPGGRTVWLRAARPLASAASMQHVARLAERESERRAAEIAGQARATARLSTELVNGFDRLRRVRWARTRASRRRIATGDNQLDHRLARTREELRMRLDTQFAIDRENLRRFRRRGLWDQILLATALPLFTAYGERASPLGVNNLTLVFLLLIWLAGDQVVEAVFGSAGSKPKYAFPDADAWSYLAPAANVLAAWWLLGGRQHERFVSGVTTMQLATERPRPAVGGMSYRSHVRVPLESRIAADDYADFETSPSATVVASVGSVRLSALGTAVQAQPQSPKANVSAGELRLSLRVIAQGGPLPDGSNLGELDVAWILDTKAPCQTHRP